MKCRFLCAAFSVLSIVSMAQSADTKKAKAAKQDDTLLIGVLGAFPPELVFIREQTTQQQDTIIDGIHFYKGLIYGRKVVIAQTGIGKVNAAVTTTLMLAHFHPSAIIFSGIAGGINPALSPGDIIVGEKLAYHDYGAITPDSMLIRPTKHPVSMEENPLYFPCDEFLVEQALMVSRTIDFGLVRRAHGRMRPLVKKGIIVTGDVFVSSSKMTKKLWANLHADATEMEGAAIAQVCWQQNLPFLIIRSLSDDAGNKAYMDMKSFYETAAKNSAMLVLALLAEMTK